MLSEIKIENITTNYVLQYCIDQYYKVELKETIRRYYPKQFQIYKFVRSKAVNSKVGSFQDNYFMVELDTEQNFHLEKDLAEKFFVKIPRTWRRNMNRFQRGNLMKTIVVKCK